MKTDIPQGKSKPMNSRWIRIATFVLIGLVLFPGWIWWLVRPDPIPKGGDYTPAMTEVFGLLEESGPDKNYFTRKLALARLHLRVDQLSDYPQTEDFVGPIKREYGNRLFSRKEWLGF